MRSALLVALSHFQEFINSATPTDPPPAVRCTAQNTAGCTKYCPVHYNVNAHIPLQAYFSKVKLMHVILFLYLFICWFLVATANVYFIFIKQIPELRSKLHMSSNGGRLTDCKWWQHHPSQMCRWSSLCSVKCVKSREQEMFLCCKSQRACCNLVKLDPVLGCILLCNLFHGEIGTECSDYKCSKPNIVLL